jgi:hypothetical protein
MQLSHDNQLFVTLHHMQENLGNHLQDNSKSDNTPFAWSYFVSPLKVSWVIRIS